MNIIPTNEELEHFLNSFSTHPEHAGDYWWVATKDSHLQKVTVEESSASGRFCRSLGMGGSALCGLRPWSGFFKPVLTP